MKHTIGTNAPIALFVYNRVEHTRRTVTALSRNERAGESTLHVFSDAPRTAQAEEGVQAVRAYLRTISGFGQIEIVERDRNLGLAGSIIDGVTRICSEQGRVIVVEDDLVTSRWFLTYMNDGLELFRDDARVASVHAYRPPVGNALGNFFLYGTDCWGWATWARAWDGFNADASSLLRQLKSHPERRYFDYLGAWPHTSMLKGYLAGRNNSWAIRWHASMFLAGKLTLHPPRSLVNNIGLDGTGTHCADNDDMSTSIEEAPVPVERIPVEHSRREWRRFQRYYVRQFFTRAVRKVLP